jgi:hypothetical protein
MIVMGWLWFDTQDMLSRLDTLHANQLVILNKLNVIIGKENTMAVDLSALTAEVARNTTVEQSVVTLVNNLAAQIAAIPPSTDPVTQAALDALNATLTQNDDAIASAVAANTPASAKK